MGYGGLTDFAQEWRDVFQTQDSIHLDGGDGAARHGRRFGRFGVLRDDDSAARFDASRAARAVSSGPGRRGAGPEGGPRQARHSDRPAVSRRAPTTRR